MNRSYAFTVSDEAEAFCDEIVEEMTKAFGIPESEAVARMNRLWAGNHFKKEDVRYHETPEFWARDIYYGADSYWWTNPPGLNPKPFP